MEIVEFLRARLDEDEWWARESSRRGEQYTESGEHWRWEDADRDVVVVPDPPAGEFMSGPDDGWNMSLRSVEQYPSRSVGPLPHFALSHCEEVESTVAGHIARHDPDRVLREVGAKRRIVDELAPLLGFEAQEKYDNTDNVHYGIASERAERLIRLLASAWSDHADYRQEWKP